MKRKTVVVVALISSWLLPLVCVAGGWFELDVARDPKGVYSRSVMGGVSGWSQSNSAVGYYVFGQAVEGGYAQIYAGPHFRVNAFEFGIAAGVEHVPGSGDTWTLRRAGYVALSKEKFFALGIFEVGQSGNSWHKVVMTYAINSEWNFGLINQAFLGTGVRAEYALSENISIQGMTFSDGGEINSAIAIQYHW
ncbi:MAG: hypothetical protein IPK84_02455 [Candidatus Moraniibacteriota bacterium]|nr:MAG: hypothetical protein IPK84_02455 [Candidatus Moranbacteria bacterium]